MDNSELWGAKRAGRSLDVVIINKSGISFKQSWGACSRGSPSSGLLVESHLDGQTSTVLGFQSADDDSYAYIFCSVVFSEGRENGEVFNIQCYPQNVRGDIFSVGITQSEGIMVGAVDSSLDTGNSNNQFVFQVRNNSDDSPFKLNQGAVPVRQRKPKGSRNMLVKASKRGTSVRRILKIAG